MWRKRSAKNEWAPALSPSGQWLAFVSGDPSSASGDYDEIHVVDRSAEGAGREVSLGVGAEPVWAPRGNELFYRKNAAIVAVRTLGQPETWVSTTRVVVNDSEDNRLQPQRPGLEGRFESPAFDVGPDGRLVVLKRPGSDGPPHLEAIAMCSNDNRATPFR